MLPGRETGGRSGAMNIVFLDADTIGADMDLSGFERLGSVTPVREYHTGAGAGPCPGRRCADCEQGRSE